MPPASDVLRRWQARGHVSRLDGRDTFVLDVRRARRPGGRRCSCSTASRRVRTTGARCSRRSAQDRRVVLFDFFGFGLSAKPDVRYSIRRYADQAARVARARRARIGRARDPRHGRHGRRRAPRPLTSKAARLRRSQRACSRTAASTSRWRTSRRASSSSSRSTTRASTSPARATTAAPNSRPASRRRSRVRIPPPTRSSTRSGSSSRINDGHTLLRAHDPLHRGSARRGGRASRGRSRRTRRRWVSCGARSIRSRCAR